MRRTLFALAFSLVALGSISAQSEDQRPAFWWNISPAMTLPLGLDASYFSTGVTVDISGEYVHPALRGLAPLLRMDLNYVPLSVSGVGGLYEAALSLGAAYRVPLFGPVSGRLFADLGYSFVDLITHVTSSGYFFENNGFTEAGAGLSYALTRSVDLRFDAFYTYYFQLYGTLGLSLGAAFTLSPQNAPAGVQPPGRPRLLDMRGIHLGSVFPIFHAFYDDHPVGSVVVKNTGKTPLTDVRVSFIIKEYMDGPKESAAIAELEPGKAREVPLYALFKSSILGVTEPTKVTAEVDSTYREGNGSQDQAAVTATVLVYDRNAMTWDDDRKAAAFVSAKDPWVLDLSDNVSAMVRDLRNPGVVKNLQTAIAFHDALRIYGLAYSPNPSTPYSYTSTHPETVDFLKFPRQTLRYRAGDCSDLSILYASLFESVGVETAFITVPGHIFMAVNLDLSPQEAKERVADWEDLIFLDGKSWLPIETTIRDRGLQDAWHEGAREWRQGVQDKTAAFYPVHDAWKTYQPVGLAADNTAVQVPAQDLVRLAFGAELSTLVDREISTRVAALDEAISTGPTPKAFNERGVVYAKFGRYEQAEKDFLAALDAQSGYVYALLNLGNLSKLRSDWQTAYRYYSRAVKAAPESSRALLELAGAAAAMGKREEAEADYTSAKQMDPKLAARYQAPGQETPGGTRAAEADKHSIDWAEE
jgi:transglutaminase-like putative cysteine protease